MQKKKRASVLLRREFFKDEKLAELYKQASIRTTRQTMINTHSIPDKVFHFTRKEHLESILSEGLKAGLDGGVFVSTSLEENISHLIHNIVEVDGFLNPLTQNIMPNNEKIEDYLIVEGTPIGTYRKNWLAYINKSDDNKHTLFYLGDLLKLENVKIHKATDLQK